jgi:hypothetical protein
MNNILATAIALFLMTACSQFPQVDAFPASSGGEVPSLVPIDTLLAQADAPASDRAAPLPARAARLKARAALMRGPILDPATRERLAAAIRAGAA